MDEEENLIQTERVATQTRPNLTIISTRRPQGAALPPAQGGPALTPAEMQTLAGSGNTLPNRGQASFRPGLANAERSDSIQPMGLSPASPETLDALRKELDDELSSLNTREALDQAVQSIGRGGVEIPQNDTESDAGPSAQSVQGFSDAPKPIPSAQNFTKRGREVAARRLQDSLSGIVRRRKPMSDDAAASDPETFHFPTLEEMDADTPMPW